jgi:predicted ATPase
MRIAVSGAHRVGKTTLVEELSAALPAYRTVDEPYHLLEEEGHEFADVPAVEDFELQLERSIACLSEGEGDVVFDRCPADLLAYLLTHDDADAFDLDAWLPRARDAIAQLDLVVFVPIEDPDRIAMSRTPDADWRQRVDEQLRAILVDDSHDLAAPVLEVSGSPRDRARQVLAHLSSLRG